MSGPSDASCLVRAGTPLSLGERLAARRVQKRRRLENVANDKRNENVETLASLRTRAELGVSRHQRFIERFTGQIARPRSVYVMMLLVTCWVAVNAVSSRLGFRTVDPPPFAWMQGLIGLSALVMTTTILITQHRQSQQAEQRAQLELQLSLLAEQKVAKLIALIEELRRDMPSVHDRVDAVAEVMKEPVDPHAVLSALEQTMEGELASAASPTSAGGEAARRQ